MFFGWKWRTLVALLVQPAMRVVFFILCMYMRCIRASPSFNTCLQQGLTRYASNYPVGVILYNRQVFEVQSTEKACVNPSSPSNPRRVVVQPSYEGWMLIIQTLPRWCRRRQAERVRLWRCALGVRCKGIDGWFVWARQCLCRAKCVPRIPPS